MTSNHGAIRELKPFNRRETETEDNKGSIEVLSAANALFDNQLLTIEDLANLLGKKPQTIRNWVAQRRIPFVPGRPVKFLRASIVAWLKNQEIQPCQ